MPNNTVQGGEAIRIRESFVYRKKVQAARVKMGRRESSEAGALVGQG